MRCNVKFKKGKLICCLSISHCKQTMFCRQWRFGAKAAKNKHKKTRKQLKIKTHIIRLIFLPKVSLHNYAHNYSGNTLLIFILILKKLVFDRCQKHKQETYDLASKL